MAGAFSMNKGLIDEVVNGNGRVVDPHATEGERVYTMFLHLTMIVALVWVPVVPALIMWLVKKDRSPFIDDHGREALNFQFSLLCYAVAAIVLTCGVGIVLLVPIYILAIVGM